MIPVCLVGAINPCCHLDDCVWILLLCCFGKHLCNTGFLVLLEVEYNKKTSIFNQAFLKFPSPCSLTFSPWKFNSIIQYVLHFPPPLVHTHTHDTDTHDGLPAVWFMDCDCCMWGTCFHRGSWLVSRPTFSFSILFVFLPYSHLPYLFPSSGSKVLSFSNSIPFPWRCNVFFFFLYFWPSPRPQDPAAYSCFISFLLPV